MWYVKNDTSFFQINLDLSVADNITNIFICRFLFI